MGEHIILTATSGWSLSVCRTEPDGAAGSSFAAELLR